MKTFSPSNSPKNKRIAGVSLTQRDSEVFDLMSEFGGKTYPFVLSQTFWFGLSKSEQQARDRMRLLKKKYNLVRLTPTGLMSPRNAIAFTESGKKWITENFEIEIGTLFMSPVTVLHNCFEQIAYFWIKKSGRDVSRTIVKNWSKNHQHTPDLLYFHQSERNEKKPVYVEIELHSKTAQKYLEIIQKSKKDGIHAILYIFENEKKMRQIGRKLPIDEKIYLTNIDDLIQSVTQKNKIGAMKQLDFFKKYEGK